MVSEKRSLQISSIQLKNFRCFKNKTVQLTSPLVLLEGANGTGKTSLLEALYYACYLRSFRTHTPRELAALGNDHFFIRLQVEGQREQQQFNHEIRVGYQDGTRLVKIDDQAVSSYKQLLDVVRVVSVTEDDLALVQGAPQVRRCFLDQALLLDDPSYVDLIAQLRHCVAGRNALIMQGRGGEGFELASRQLYDISVLVRSRRQEYLNMLIQRVNDILQTSFAGTIQVDIAYRKVTSEPEQLDLWLDQGLIEREKRMSRSLVGAQLDDIIVRFDHRRSRSFSSRGEQKLIVFLLKIAQMRLLSAKGRGGVFILDDFLTDFDQSRATVLLNVVAGLDSHILFATPIIGGFMRDWLLDRGAQVELL